MTREEILARSRRENHNMDEREQRSAQFAKGISGAFGLFLCMALNLLNSYNNGPESVGHAMWTIACGIYAAEHWVNALRLKQPHSWLFAACFTAIGIAHLSRYLGAIL